MCNNWSHLSLQKEKTHKSWKKIPSDSQPNPLQVGAARSDVMSADAVALCMGISDSTQKLVISSGDLQMPKHRYQYVHRDPENGTRKPNVPSEPVTKSSRTLEGGVEQKPGAALGAEPAQRGRQLWRLLRGGRRRWIRIGGRISQRRRRPFRRCVRYAVARGGGRGDGG